MKTTSWMYTTRPTRSGFSVVSRASTDTCPRITLRKTKLPALPTMVLPPLWLLPRSMSPSRESGKNPFQKVHRPSSDARRLLTTSPLRQLSRAASLPGPPAIKNHLEPSPLPANSAANTVDNTQSPATAGRRVAVTKAGRPHDLPRIAAAIHRNPPNS